MKRGIELLSIVILILMVSGCSESKSARFRPGAHQYCDFNCILISLDTLRKDRLGVNGCSLPISPFLDQWSLQSAVMSDVMAQSATTRTSHRAVFLSRYLFGQDKSASKPEKTLAGVLSAAGWTTAAFVDGGKMHHSFGNDVGFQSYDDEGGGFEKILPKVDVWLDEHRAGKFFLFVHTYDIHSPQDPPDPFEKIFAEKPLLDRSIRKKNPPEFNSMNLDHAQADYISNLYNAEIRWTDRVLRRLFEKIGSLGLLEKTIIIVMSDHGESFGERGYFGHHQLYNAQTMVPMIWHIPKRGGRIVPEPVENIDIMPTILELFEVTPPQGLHGTTIARAIHDGERLRADRMHYSEEAHRAIMRPDGFKLILRNTPELDELYDSRSDPWERENRREADIDQAAVLSKEIVSLTGLELENLRKPITWGHILIKRSQDVDDALEHQLNALGYVE